MTKHRTYIVLAVTLVLNLARVPTAMGQSNFAGASIRLFNNDKLLGWSLEAGREFSFGWLFLQGAYFNRKLEYDRAGAFDGMSVNQFGQSVAELSAESEVGGFAVDAGDHLAESSTAYFPEGAQFVLSTTYCYPVTSGIMLGPTIGIAWIKESPVQAVVIDEMEANGYHLRTNPFYGPQQTDVPTKRVFVGNFGGSVKFAFGKHPNSVLLILDYATQTGAGLGLAIPF